MKILCSKSYEKEKEYILSFIFNDFLGINCEILFSEKLPSGYEISHRDKILKITDVFFNQNKNGWLTQEWLPKMPLRQFHASDYSLEKCCLVNLIPEFFPNLKSTQIIHLEKKEPQINLDIFGTAFFFLTRYEEFVSNDFDEHGRFPFHSSVSSKHSIIERPIVNEYIEILWNIIKKIWPEQKRTQKQFKINLTHDIDRPVFNENSKNLHFKHYDRMLNLAEQYKIKSTYYFLTSRTSVYDANYTLDDIEIQKLMKIVHERGHTVGLHPSYGSIRNKKIMKQELDRLKKTCEKLEIYQTNWESRQHYLRFYPNSTWNHIEHAGVSFDSTLGFADRVGFRCGFCSDFPVFDLLNTRQLNLREKPLMIMDDTVVSKSYMNLPLEHRSALEACATIKEACKHYRGTLTILFHDNYLYEEPYFNLLESLLKY